MVEQAIDRCAGLQHADSDAGIQEREIQKLVGTKYYARAMGGDIDSGHLYARINERYCAMQGWTSVNIRLDPYAAQIKEQPSQHEQIRDAIFRIKYGPQWQPSDSFGADGALPLVRWPHVPV